MGASRTRDPSSETSDLGDILQPATRTASDDSIQGFGRKGSTPPMTRLLCLVWTCVLLIAGIHSAFAGGSVLSIGSGEGANGETLGVVISLDNDTQMKALQFDLTYDSGVIQFVSGSGAMRGANLTATFGSSGPGRLRTVFHLADDSFIPNGSGQIGVLEFRLIGGKNASTSLVPTGLVLSDPDAQKVPLTGTQGSILVTRGPAAVPTFQIVTLKNPGRTRTFRGFVRVENGSGTAPVVTVNDAAVVPTSVDADLYTFEHFASADEDAVTIFVSDTNAEGTGTDQRVVIVE